MVKEHLRESSLSPSHPNFMKKLYFDINSISPQPQLQKMLATQGPILPRPKTAQTKVADKNRKLELKDLYAVDALEGYLEYEKSRGLSPTKTTLRGGTLTDRQLLASVANIDITSARVNIYDSTTTESTDK